MKKWCVLSSVDEYKPMNCILKKRAGTQCPWQRQHRSYEHVVIHDYTLECQDLEEYRLQTLQGTISCKITQSTKKQDTAGLFLVQSNEHQKNMKDHKQSG